MTGMKKHPLLSVIMTVYNGEAFLQETLDGVFAQTFTDFELVAVNNASTDGTQALLDAVTDKRLRIVQAPVHGSFGDGIRLAYEHARGKYIAVQDADDVSLPERFAREVAALEADLSVGLVSSAYEYIDQYGTHLGFGYAPVDQATLVDTFQTSNPLTHSTFMYRKTAADDVGGYPAEYAYGPDFALVIRMLKAGWKVRVLEDVLLKWRQHVGQASLVSTLNVTRALDALRLYGEARDLQGVSPAAARLGARNLVKCKMQYAMALLGEARWDEGLTHLAAGIAANPLYGSAYLGYQFCRKVGLLAPAEP